MSTLNMESIGNTTILSGDLTMNTSEMMDELGDKNHMYFGQLRYSEKSGDLVLPDNTQVTNLSETTLLNLYNNGTNEEYFLENSTFCYLCVRPSDLHNYMFSPLDSENRDNDYQRLREGVHYFAEQGFKIYAMH